MKPCETCVYLVEGDCQSYGILGQKRAMRLGYCNRNPKVEVKEMGKKRVGQQKQKGKK